MSIHSSSASVPRARDPRGCARASRVSELIGDGHRAAAVAGGVRACGSGFTSTGAGAAVSITTTITKTLYVFQELKFVFLPNLRYLFIRRLVIHVLNQWLHLLLKTVADFVI